jgi:hypothetical protein
MKCPKCKYTTFDYVDTCPRCGKDISGEKSKLHIMSLKPNTPFLLGSLTGDLNDSSASFAVPKSVRESSESMSFNSSEIYDDGSELNINVDEEPVAESDGEEEGLDTLTSGDYEMELDLDSGQAPEEIEVPSDQEMGSEGGTMVEKDSKKKADEDLELDLDDLDLKLDLDEEDSDKS